MLFSRFFLSRNFLKKSHIFPTIPGSKNAEIITHIFKVFLEHFQNRKILRCLQCGSFLDAEFSRLGSTG